MRLVPAHSTIRRPPSRISENIEDVAAKVALLPPAPVIFHVRNSCPDFRAGQSTSFAVFQSGKIGVATHDHSDV